MNLDPAKHAWQASVEIAGAPPLDEVRKGADKFYRRIRLRNTIEYISCAVVVVYSVYQLLVMPHVLHKIGFALLIAAAVYAPWQLHRRASAVAPGITETMPISMFMRAQLVRQRDALRSIFGWYILPFLPGIVAILAGNGLDPKTEAAGPPIWARWLALTVMVSVFVGIWWLNQHAARKLQRRIDEIDALRGEAGPAV